MSHTILVIEDERGTRRSLKSFLSTEGYEVITAENGRLGIELARTHIPDLIICDIMMPELDGYDVLRILQTELNTANIPFIFLTMAADDFGCQQSLDLGADDYLRKPVTSDRLRAAIQNQIFPKDDLSNTSEANTTINLNINPEINPSDSQSLQERLLVGLCKNYVDQLTDINQLIDILIKEKPDISTHSSILETRQKITNLLRITNQTTALNNSLPDGNLLQLVESFLESMQEI